MKKVLVMIIVLCSLKSMAQCVQCYSDFTFVPGTNASVLGTNTHAAWHSSLASGYQSTASGYQSTASGNYSTAIGYNSYASGIYSVSIGKNVNVSNTSFAFGRDIAASAMNSMIIGVGYTSSSIMTNDIQKSIMLGVYSSQPSIIIRQMSMQDLPANVGIGTIEPKQQLHINGNTLISGTNKSLLFAGTSTSEGEFGIQYKDDGLNFFLPNDGTPTNYLLFINDDGNIGFGKNNPNERIDVNGTAKATKIIASTSIQAASLNVVGLSNIGSLQVSENITFSALSGESSKAIVVDTNFYQLLISPYRELLRIVDIEKDSVIYHYAIIKYYEIGSVN